MSFSATGVVGRVESSGVTRSPYRRPPERLLSKDDKETALLPWNYPGRMQLPLSAAVVDRLEIVDAGGSPNTELVASAADPELPDFSVLVTADQTAGRGRLGRVWVAPPGKTLA